MASPSQVHELVARHRLADGYDFVLDLGESRGSRLVDARDGTTYLDMFTFYASLPLGFNPPQLVEDGEFLRALTQAALHKPSNDDAYTAHFARFLETFSRVLGDPDLPYLFFIEGGALAVENALKAALDWKRQHNAANGRHMRLGTKVLHLTRAFHGRSGYTMSLTNTEPAKVARFPKFDWPRIQVPVTRFPVEDHLEEIERAEEHALVEAHAAFDEHGHDIACFIAEPIQGEGGDNHLRREFLRAMQELCAEHDALFVLDEVQTGTGVTGEPWCYQHFDLEPDLVAFGKKSQVCGVMGGRRIGEVEGNVFAVPGRISSTWSGNLVDMVRVTRVLEVMEDEQLIPRAAATGKQLLDGIEGLAGEHPALVSNPRGRGLLAAFDLPDTPTRDRLVNLLRTEERVLILPCGTVSVRFRPHLAVEEAELLEAVEACARVLSRLDPGG